MHITTNVTTMILNILMTIIPIGIMTEIMVLAYHKAMIINPSSAVQRKLHLCNKNS